MRVQLLNMQGCREVTSPDLPTLLQNPEAIVWVDMVGPTHEDLRVMREIFKFHPLAIEDTLSDSSRPVAAEYPEHIFAVLNPINTAQGDPGFRELNLFLGPNFVVTVHRGYEPLIGHLTERLDSITSTSNTTLSTGYVMYILLDTIVDDYFEVLERMGDEIEALGDTILQHTRRETMTRLFEIKHFLAKMWRVIGHQRDVYQMLANLHKERKTNQALKYYLRDTAAHLSRAAETVKIYRDNISNLFDLYMSAASNRLNIFVQRFTIITVLVGMLTVISGFYGMNFEETWPPFSSPWGVPFVLMLMVIAGVAVFLLARQRE